MPHTAGYTAEEIGLMSLEQLERIVDPALLERVTAETIASLTPEQIGWFVNVKRDHGISTDYSPDELASMRREELARVVPRPYLDRYGIDVLSQMTADELEHLIPTGTWLNLRFKGLAHASGVDGNQARGKGVDVRKNLAVIGTDGEVPREPQGRKGAGGMSQERSGRWAVVYAPHPDDETFGIAGYTNRLHRAGWNIAQVLCTRGEGSSYYFLGRSRGWWNTREEFGKLRVKEWVSATARISPALRFQYDCGDGELTIAEARSIIEYVDEFVGGASLHCATRGGLWEPHVDHQALSEGLRQAFVPMGTKRWYSVYSDGPVTGPGTTRYRLTRENRAAKIAALREYRRENHSRGSYGIGYHTSPFIWRREWRDRREFITLADRDAAFPE